MARGEVSVMSCSYMWMFLGGPLTKAIALPAVELFQSSWKLTTQALYIIIVVDVRSTCLQPGAVLFDSFLPSSLGCCLDKSIVHPSHCCLVQHDLLQ